MKPCALAASIARAALLFACIPHAFAGYTVTGRFLYQDREFGMDGFTGKVTPRPIRHADVRIMAGTSVLAQGATAEDGTYSVVVTDSTARTITAICVASSTQSPPLLLDVRVANNDYSFGDFYSVSSDPVGVSGSGAVDLGTTTALKDNDAGSVFNLWDVAIDSEQFLASPNENGSFPDQKLTVLWRLDHPRIGSFYSYSSAGRYIFITGYSAYDDTILSHEFGHFVDDVFSNSDSPGGQHFIGDNTQDIRLSWAEGLATFLGCSARNFKGYARPEIYVSTDGTNLNFSYEIEHLTGSVSLASKTGSTNEVAVSAALWDIVDGPGTPDADPGDDDDPMQVPFSLVWKVLTRYMPMVTRPGISIETFWDGWFSPEVQNGSLYLMQTVFSTVNGIEFLLDAEEPDNAAAAAPGVRSPQPPPLVAGPKVLLSELDLGITDAVELYNAGDTEVNITGWTLEATAPGGVGVTARVVDTIPAFKLAPGAFVVVSEANGNNTNSVLYLNRDTYPGRNIPWANDQSGSCLLRDGAGNAIAFVRWGSSTEPVPAGIPFPSPNPAPPPSGLNLARSFSETDTGNGNDWSSQTPTLGTFNLSGLEKHHTYYPAGDVDYVSFDAIAGYHYLVETMNLQNGADTIVDLLDTDGLTVLVYNDDFGVSVSSRLSWTAPATGRYFVRSHRFDGPTNFARYGSYDLRVVENPTAFTIPLPATLTVSQPGQGGEYQSLSDAVYAAANGDTVEILDNAAYRESVVVTGKSITIEPSAGRTPTLDGRGGYLQAALNIIDAKTLRVSGLTILGGGRGVRIDGGNVTIQDSVVSGANDPSGYADGIQVVGQGSSLSLVNSTIVGNGRLGVGVFNSASARIANTIFRGNPGGDIDGDHSAASLVIRNCLLEQAAYTGPEGYFLGDPQFVDFANGDLHLKSTSPAIDAGDPEDPDLPLTDADGLPRSLDGKGSGKPVPDIGAYEYLNLGLLTSSATFPQIAAGGTAPAWRTSVVGVNTGSRIALANLRFYKANADPFPVTFLDALRRSEDSGPAPMLLQERDPSSLNFAIAPWGAARIETRSDGNVVSGYAKLLSGLPLGGSAVFKTMNGETVLSEAGVALSKPSANFTVYVDNVGTANSGYALANAGSTPADITMTLRNSAGTVAGSKTISIPPGGQFAKFAAEADQFGAKAAAGFEGSIEFLSTRDLSAIALRFDNPAQDVFSTIPVLATAAATTLYFPQIADGAGNRTDFILVNPSFTAAAAGLEFFDDGGNRMNVSMGGTAVSSVNLQLPPKGTYRIRTDGASPVGRVGWARVTSTVPIGGSAIFQTLNGTNIASEVGVAASPLSNHMAVYVESFGFAESGLALCNPNAVPVTVTLRLHDSLGLDAGSAQVQLLPYEHTAKFFTQWFDAVAGQFQGTLEVIAAEPIGAVALRYDNPQQNVFAALPVIMIQ